MNAKDIITRPLVSITSEETVLEAARLMVENNMGLLVVCDPKDNGLRGVVSERDIIRSVASGKDVAMKVESISTPAVVTVKWNSDVAEAAKAMNKHRIRHVVVVDDGVNQ